MGFSRSRVLGKGTEGGVGRVDELAAGVLSNDLEDDADGDAGDEVENVLAGRKLRQGVAKGLFPFLPAGIFIGFLRTAIELDVTGLGFEKRFAAASDGSGS